MRAADVADLISYIQHTLGFPPTDSLAGISMAGHRLGAVLRCDWDAAVMGVGRVHERYLRMFAGHLAQDVRADACIVVLFRDHPDHDVEGPGAADPITAADHRLAIALDRELREVGLELRELWLVAAGRTWHVGCPQPASCPGHGASLSRVETSVVNTSLIVEGSLVSAEQGDSGLPRPAERPSPDLMAALAHVLGHRGPRTGRPDGRDGSDEGAPDGTGDPDREREEAEAASLAVWLEGWERVLTGDGLSGDPRIRALLAAGLVRVRWRDCLMASASLGLEGAVSGAAWWGTVPEQVADLFAVEAREVDGVRYSSVMLGATRRPPEWARIALLRDACAVLIPESSGPVATALQCLVAWVEWARGRGSVAGRILAESGRDDPDYPLGQLLTEIVDAGLICDWATRRETAWSAIGR